MQYAGVQFYRGTDQHVASLAGCREQIATRTAYLQTIFFALANTGFKVPTVRNGGTGSFAIDADLDVLTELQIGSKVLLARENLDCEFDSSVPALDRRVTPLPPHCDPTVNLNHRYAVCDGPSVFDSGRSLLADAAADGHRSSNIKRDTGGPSEGQSGSD